MVAGSDSAIVPASASARGSSSSWGTTSLTRPHAHAVAASTKSPVSDI